MSISTEKRIAQVTYNGVSIPLAKETWVLNQVVDTATKFSYSKNFTANGVSYSSISVGGSTAPGAGGMVYNLRYGNTTVANSGSFGTTDEKNVNRKITFSEPATGELLAWLETNGVKVSESNALQAEKSLVAYVGDSVPVTPDVPFDGLTKLNIEARNRSTTLTINSTDYQSAYMQLFYLLDDGTIGVKNSTVITRFPYTVNTQIGSGVFFTFSGLSGIPNLDSGVNCVYRFYQQMFVVYPTGDGASIRLYNAD